MKKKLNKIFKLDFSEAKKILADKKLLIDYSVPEHLSKKKFTATNIHNDSRNLLDDEAFVAYQGINSDLHSYINDDLLDKCSFLVCEKSNYLKNNKCHVLQVKNARAAWAWLAALGWKNPQDNLKIIGITGTNGKTSTCHFLLKILEQNNVSVLGIGTLGLYINSSWQQGRHTTPDPQQLFEWLALAKSSNISHIVMEVSSHALAHNKLLPISFDAAIFTSFSRDHLDFHKDMDEYWQTKMLLFTKNSKKKAVFYVNHTLVTKFSNETKSPFKAYDASCKEGESLLGDFMRENFCGAYLAATDLLKTKPLIKSIEAPPGRLQTYSSLSGPLVVVDYAHTPDALDKSLSSCRDYIQQNKLGRLLLVFGCGGNRDSGKRALMGKVAENKADFIYLTSDNPRDEDPNIIITQIDSAISNKSKRQIVVDRSEAIKSVILNATKNDLVLIAGKGHENYQIIKDKTIYFDDMEIAKKTYTQRKARAEDN